MTDKCLICGQFVNNLRLHLTEEHQSKVALTALNPSDDRLSVWIQKSVWNGRIHPAVISVKQEVNEDIPNSNYEQEQEDEEGYQSGEGSSHDSMRRHSQRVVLSHSRVLSSLPSAKQEFDEVPDSSEAAISIVKEEPLEDAESSTSSVSSAVIEFQDCTDESAIFNCCLSDRKPIINAFGDNFVVKSEVTSEMEAIGCENVILAQTAENRPKMEIDDQAITENEDNIANASTSFTVQSIPGDLEDELSNIEAATFKPIPQDSKPVWCHECKAHTSNAQSHLYKVHAKLLPLFKCPVCDYVSSNDKCVEDHLRTIHVADFGNLLAAISQVDQFTSELERIRRLCYRNRLSSKAEKKRCAEAPKKSCLLCGKQVTSSKLDHIFKHLNKSDMFSCKLCPYTNKAWRKTAMMHARSVHQDPMAIVSRETEFTAKIEALKVQCFGSSHKIDLKKKRLESALGFRCSKCARVVDKYDKREHVKRHHIPPRFQCPDSSCARMFAQRTHGHRHVIDKHGLDQSALIDVSADSAYSVDLPKLIVECFGGPPPQSVSASSRNSGEKEKKLEWIVCKVCNKSVDTSHKGDHVRRAHIPARFSCEECGRAFRQRSSASTHLRKMHLNKGKIVDHTAQYAHLLGKMTAECFG